MVNNLSNGIIFDDIKWQKFILVIAYLNKHDNIQYLPNIMETSFRLYVIKLTETIMNVT